MHKHKNNGANGSGNGVNRHDVLFFIEVINSNLNGDPDNGNMPRVEPNSGCGLGSDGCQKRKIRDRIIELDLPPSPSGNEYNVLVRHGNVLNAEIRKGEKEANPDLVPGTKLKHADKDAAAKAAMGYICRHFIDVRMFGGVLGTGKEENGKEKGVLCGSAHGQARGPVQFAIAQSLDPVRVQEIGITRCVATKEEEAYKERTMGNKFVVAYGLYVGKMYVNPVLAARTGFDSYDLDLLFQVLPYMFSNDHAAGRAEINMLAIYDFEHVGTQGSGNLAQDLRERQLGCAHAHRLFKGVTCKRKPDERTYPTKFDDYELSDSWQEDENGLILPGVKLNRILAPYGAVKGAAESAPADVKTNRIMAPNGAVKGHHTV